MTDFTRMDPDEKVQKALMHVVLHKPFFGAMVMRLDVAADRCGHPSCWTDGKVLRYNREWAKAMSFEMLVTVLCARVTACALGHPFRRGARSLKEWCEASEHVVNLTLLEEKDAGFVFPEGALMDKRFDGLSVEQVWSALKLAQQQEPEPQPQEMPTGMGGEGEPSSERLEASQGQPSDEEQQSDEGQPTDGEVSPDAQQKKGEAEQPPQEQQEQEQQDEGEGEGEDEEDGEGEGVDADGAEHGLDGADDHEPEGDELEDAPGRQMGDVMDGGTGAELEEDEAPLSPQEMSEQNENWQHATAAAAMQAEARGDASANTLRSLRKQFEPKLAYDEHMQMFVSKLARDEQSWQRPRRSAAASGVYLPTQRSMKVGKLIFAIDTSGSINERVLSQFQADAEQARLDLDPESVVVVYVDAEVCGTEEFERGDEIEFKQPAGGGGTDFEPLFKWVDEQREQGEEIVGVIYLTDLDGDFPDQEPEYPVLWVSTDPKEVAPFGETAHFDLKK